MNNQDISNNFDEMSDDGTASEQIAEELADALSAEVKKVSAKTKAAKAAAEKAAVTATIEQTASAAGEGADEMGAVLSQYQEQLLNTVKTQKEKRQIQASMQKAIARKAGKKEQEILYQASRRAAFASGVSSDAYRQMLAEAGLQTDEQKAAVQMAYEKQLRKTMKAAYRKELIGKLSKQKTQALMKKAEQKKREKYAKRAVLSFLLGVVLVVLFGSVPALRPSFMVDGEMQRLSMPHTIEIIMMSIAALILIAGKADVKDAVKGNIFGAGMNAMVSIFGIAWMGDTFFNGNLEFFRSHIADIVTQYPFLFAVALFIMSIMLFSQAATVRTLYPLGIGLGIPPLALVAMFPAVNGYFFIPNYPTEVAAINFDTTGTTRIGKYVLNHSFQLSGFITTFVSIGVGYLITTFLY